MANRTDITTCSKFVYLILSFITTLGGMAVMGFGIAIIVEINDFLELMPYNPKVIAGLSIAFGALTICSTAVGVFGTIKEARWVLIGNIIFMFALAAVKIWMTVAIFMNINDLYMMVRAVLDAAVHNPNLPESFHLIEERFFCCGSTGADSYFEFGRPVPPSCCFNPSDGVCQPNMSFLGCNRLVADFFETFGVIIGHIIARVAALQIVTAVSGIFLLAFIRIKLREKSRV